MSQIVDLSQGWELSWSPEPVLGQWKQILIGWSIKDGNLVGNSPGTAEIVANVELEEDYVWESVVCIETPGTTFGVMVCFSEERNTYYQILLAPGSQIFANYILYDIPEGELMSPRGPVIQSGTDYAIRVSVSGRSVEIFLDGECIGAFSDPRFCGHRVGFLVQQGTAYIRQARVVKADGSGILFENDFTPDSLARTVPITLEDLVTERWIPAVVPGTVHTALLNAGLIEDPYVGYNGPQQRWIDRQRWVYRRSFIIPPESAGQNIALIFQGIDYHGYIWLNGELLDYHEGMHRARTFDITGKVRRTGENELVVCLLPCPSPPSSNVKAYILQRWHFNMDILTVGLWRPVALYIFEKVRILDPQVITKSFDGDDALLDVSFTLASSAEMYPSGPGGTITISSPDPDDEIITIPFSTGYFRGAQRQEFKIRIPKAKRWWPNGLGEQALYHLKIDVWLVPVELREKTPPAETLELNFGVRILEMRPTPEGHWKYNWVFTVNGRPFFGKGVNWMPIDQMLRLDKDRYEALLQRAQDANINIMRAWGGGLVETDEFYDLCDRFGICIWQEFPFANSLFHEMDTNVLRDTVVQNVKRLRNHPSLVIWCCGNEFDESNKWNRSVVDMFENLCREFDPSREVHRASPHGGDSHSYQVNWEGGANYTYFTRDLSPAITEFSMASPPALHSLRKVISHEELQSWPSPGPDPLEPFEIEGWNPSFRERESAFSMHDAHLAKAQAKMMPFISDCGVPANWEQFVEYAQTSQGMLLRFGLDFWRSRWPYCTLTMGWSFNVIWPSSMTWECVDWFGVPKSSYYDYQQAYEPLHVGAVFEELFTAPGTIFRAKLFAINDTEHDYPDAVVNVRLYDIHLNLLTTKQERPTLRRDTTATVGFFAWTFPKTIEEQALFLCIDLLDREGGEVLSRSVYTPRVGMPVMRMPYLKNGPWICEVSNAPTKLKLEYAERWRKEESGWITEVLLINVGANPAYRARIECPEYDHELRYSDNHIWLEPGELKRITIRSKSSAPEALSAKAWNAEMVVFGQ